MNENETHERIELITKAISKTLNAVFDNKIEFVLMAWATQEPLLKFFSGNATAENMIRAFIGFCDDLGLKVDEVNEIFQDELSKVINQKSN